MNEAFPILIAEDDENDILILQRALREAGFNNPFHISHDGSDVMRYLQGEEPYTDRTRFKFPRVLITDLKMPGVDGFELLQWLHTHTECNLIPRLVLSSSRHEQDIKRAYQLGVNSYLVKPSSFEGLVELLRLVLKYWDACEKPPLPPPNADLSPFVSFVIRHSSFVIRHSSFVFHPICWGILLSSDAPPVRYRGS